MSYKVIPPYHVAELTTSVEQGVLLPANALMRLIVEAALARAQHLHPLTICHYLVEGTHIHMLIVTTDPSLVKDFMERFKTESSHYINALLGRKKRTVWCEDYFCVPILTLSSAMKKVRYIYTNPAKDGLESCIENYPGVSSWRGFRSGRHKKTCPRLHRPMIPYMPEPFYPRNTYKRAVKDLKGRSKSSHTLCIEPNAWMKLFGVTDAAEQDKINNTIFDLIKEEEQRFALQRQAEGKTVLGQAALLEGHLQPDYIPKRSGAKMWCICDIAEIRVRYIAWIKSLKQQAKDVYQRWKMGDFTAQYPPGVFPPAMPKGANMTRLACDY